MSMDILKVITGHIFIWNLEHWEFETLYLLFFKDYQFQLY